MKLPLISVIIPTYNRAKLLKRSIVSVLNQTYKNIEVIVVDDGSTDDTKEMIRKLNDKRIIYVFQNNSGACAARNNGIEHSNGEYISFQDSDDYWYPDKLISQYNNMCLHQSDIDICYMQLHHLNSNEEKIPNKIYNNIFYGNYISTQMILAKKDVFKHIRFDKNLPRFQDWDIAIQFLIIYRYRLSITKKSLVLQYESANSISSNSSKALKAYTIIERKYNTYLSSHKYVYSRFLYNKACFIARKGSSKDAEKYFKKSFLLFPFSIKTLLGCLKYR